MHSARGAVVSAALVAASSLFAVTAATALPPGTPAAPSGSRVVTLTCAGVGDLRVVLNATGTPAPATPLPSGVALRTAYRATESRTAATVSGGDRGDISCGEVPVHGVLFGALSNDPAPPGVVTADLFDGFVAISLVTTEPRLLAAQAVPGSGAPFPFAAALQSYLATRSGRVSVAVFNAKTGATYSYNSGTQFVTASIVKLAILGTLLRQAQDAHRSLTSTERSLATRMIEQSDNAAATSLWNEVGRGPGVGAFMSKVGMPSTIPGSDGLWGLTSTNTPDQVRLVRTVAYPNTVLSDASRGYAESLMRAVTPSQKWGVSGGVPASGTVALKNGWLPRTGGWVINSIGHVRGGTHDYVIAVLTSGNSSMSYGITTVEHVSAMVWQRLPSASFGDFSGDGWSDLIARQTSTGSLLLYRGNGTGFRVSLRIGVGWNGMDAITRFGDFNRDGHEDVIARESATGDLWLYPGTGSGFGSRLKIGIGWNGMREITPVGDVNGDGYPDVLAVKTSTGFMSLYPGRGTGFSGPSQLGPGWNAMTELAGVGDFNRDGHVDLMARNTATGDLWLYRGAGARFSSGLQVGRGWNGMRDLVGVGDFDRDGFNDLIAVRSATGNLYRYPGRGTSFGQGLVVGNGWTGMEPLL